MSLPSAYPLTSADWRRIKAATRHRRYLERMAACDEASADAWLEAVRRDDLGDPYQQEVLCLPMVVEGTGESAVDREQAPVPIIASAAPVEHAGLEVDDVRHATHPL